MHQGLRYEHKQIKLHAKYFVLEKVFFEYEIRFAVEKKTNPFFKVT